MKASAKVKLLLVDDHAIVREGIRSTLLRYPFISIAGEAGNGKEAVLKCKQLQPDIVLMDLNMPEMSGLEALPLLRKLCPRSKVIALTVHDNKEYVSQLLRRGASGYVLKDTSAEELVHAIKSVAAGGAFFSPRISSILLQDYTQTGEKPACPDEPQLSEREEDVLRRIASGETSKEVAAGLRLSVRTVETYRVRIKRKLKARNTAEMLKHARERKLL
jgi:DNA-binding NarL/FixJ family response regulator